MTQAEFYTIVGDIRRVFGYCMLACWAFFGGCYVAIWGPVGPCMAFVSLLRSQNINNFEVLTILGVCMAYS